MSIEQDVARQLPSVEEVIEGIDDGLEAMEAEETLGMRAGPTLAETLAALGREERRLLDEAAIEAEVPNDEWLDPFAALDAAIEQKWGVAPEWRSLSQREQRRQDWRVAHLCTAVRRRRVCEGRRARERRPRPSTRARGRTRRARRAGASSRTSSTDPGGDGEPPGERRAAHRRGLAPRGRR